VRLDGASLAAATQNLSPADSLWSHMEQKPDIHDANATGIKATSVAQALGGMGDSSSKDARQDDPSGSQGSLSLGDTESPSPRTLEPLPHVACRS
jgi:hypothetical protein